MVDGNVNGTWKTVRSYPKIKNRKCIGLCNLTATYISKKSKIFKNVYIFGFTRVLQDLWFWCTDFLVWCSGLAALRPVGS